MVGSTGRGGEDAVYRQNYSAGCRPLLQELSGNTVLTGILVTGTASGCDTVNVSITCTANGQPTTGVVKVPIPVINGIWTTTITKSNVGGWQPLNCECGGQFTITVQGPDGSCQDQLTGVLPCPQEIPGHPCPTIYFLPDAVDPNADCENGKRIVTGKVIIVPVPGTTLGTTVYIDSQQVGTNVSNSQYAIPYSVPLAAGLHNLTFLWSDPACSSNAQLGISVPPCPGCPKIVFHVKEGDCKDGKRLVTVEAVVPDVGAQIGATLVNSANGNKLDQKSQTGQITLTGADLFADGTNEVQVELYDVPGVSIGSLFLPGYWVRQGRRHHRLHRHLLHRAAVATMAMTAAADGAASSAASLSFRCLQ